MNIPTVLRRLSGLVALLVAAFPLCAQSAVFYVEDVTAEAGEEVMVNVRATGVSSVVGVQFSVSWDPEVLSYLGVENIALDGAPNENFNQTRVDSGYVGYLEVDQSLVGFSYADSAVVFTLRFQSLSEVSQETAIGFADTPLRFNGKYADMVDLEEDTRDGIVTLDGISSVPVYGEDARFRVAPNPFSDQINITTSLRYGGRGMLEVLDLSGRLLLQRPVVLSGSAATLTLNATDFPGTGAYVLRLVTDREQLTRKVILQGGPH